MSQFESGMKDTLRDEKVSKSYYFREHEWQDLMSDGEIKYIGQHLDKQEVMSLRASVMVTDGNELMEEPAKGWSGKRVVFGEKIVS